MKSPLQFLRARRPIIRGTVSYLFGKTSNKRIDLLRLRFWLKTRIAIHMHRSVKLPKRPLSVRLWIDGKAFDRIEKRIKRAKYSIIIQMFIWEDDKTGRRIAKALTKAADRGVVIKIMKEAVGDMFEISGDFLSTKSSNDPLWKNFWSHKNISVTHPVHHDHGKIFIFDDDILMLTGMNISDVYCYDWHDYLVELHGSHFVQQYLSLQRTSMKETYVKMLISEGEGGPMRKEIMRLLGSAKKSIIVEHAYMSDPEVMDLLIRRSKENIEVLVILPSDPDVHHNANMETAAALMAGGSKKVKVLLYPGMVHGKVILVDQKIAMIGSVNLIASSMDTMGEAAVIFTKRARRAMAKLRATLLKDTLKSKAFTPFRFSLMRKLLALLQL